MRLEEPAERRDALAEATIRPSHSILDREQFVKSDSLSGEQEVPGKGLREQLGVSRADMNLLLPMMEGKGTADRKSREDLPSEFAERHVQLRPLQSGPLFQRRLCKYQSRRSRGQRNCPDDSCVYRSIEVRATQQAKSSISKTRQISPVMTLMTSEESRKRSR
jgi:hypothetical protein